MIEGDVMGYAEKWLENYIDGVSEFIARSIGESEEEYKREKNEIKKLLMEKVKDKSLINIEKKWRDKTIAGMERAVEVLKKEKVGEVTGDVSG